MWDMRMEVQLPIMFNSDWKEGSSGTWIGGTRSTSWYPDYKNSLNCQGQIRGHIKTTPLIHTIPSDSFSSNKTNAFCFSVSRNTFFFLREFFCFVFVTKRSSSGLPESITKIHHDNWTLFKPVTCYMYRHQPTVLATLRHSTEPPRFRHRKFRFTPVSVCWRSEEMRYPKASTVSSVTEITYCFRSCFILWRTQVSWTSRESCNAIRHCTGVRKICE